MGVEGCGGAYNKGCCRPVVVAQFIKMGCCSRDTLRVAGPPENALMYKSFIIHNYFSSTVFGIQRAGLWWRRRRTTSPAQPLLDAKVGVLGLLLEGVTSFTLRCYQYLHFLGDASLIWCVQCSRRARACPWYHTLTPWGSATLPVSTSPSSFSYFTMSLVLIESGKLVCSFYKLRKLFLFSSICL